jgi:hypothetical protein
MKSTNEPRSALLTSQPHTGATGLACSQTGTKPHGEHEYPAAPRPNFPPNTSHIPLIFKILQLFV